MHIEPDNRALLHVSAYETQKIAECHFYHRFLPHIDIPGAFQSITYRLADSIPSALLRAYETELANLSPEDKASRRRYRIEELLDQGHGSCILAHEDAAHLVIHTWNHFNHQRYELVAWVVMPTHVHVLLRTYPEYPHAIVTHSWKSFTGTRLLARYPHARYHNRCWQRESFDRYIRDQNHFFAVLAYIRNNPVRAGLVENADDWPYLFCPCT